MSALGIDIAGVDDIDPFMTLADGKLAAGQSCMCALLHEPGTLWWAPDRGLGLVGFIHRQAAIEEIQLAVETECLKDERVETAVATVELFARLLEVTVKLTLTDDESKVSLTLAVNAVNEVLRAEVRG